MKKESVPELPIRVLKIGTCPTLSGRSELTYHTGRHEDESIYLRVVQNTGNGQFNPDWVALMQIENLLGEHPTKQVMSSTVMRPVYQGKSSNSPAFLFAVLKAEGIVNASEDRDGGYLLGDLEAFKSKVAKLIADATSAQPNAKPSHRRKAEY